MTNGRDYARIVEAARLHYGNLKSDIANTANRVEYIRLSALATEAHHLLTELIQFEVGLVYSHVNGIHADLSEGQTFYEPSTDTPLDLPEFKSPYNPDL
jgi:hypothetical protein